VKNFEKGIISGGFEPPPAGGPFAYESCSPLSMPLGPGPS